MKARQGNTIETLRHVQQFLDANAAVLGAVPTSGARTDLDAALASLTAMAVSQEQGTVQAQGETTKQQTLRTTLVKTYMAPIAAIAKAKLATVPEFSAFKLPKPNARAQRLLTAAAAMGNAAAPYAATFIAQGLPQDFVAELAAAADAFRASIDGRKAFKTESVGATAGAAAEASTAVRVIKVLDTMVTPLLAGDPKLLAKWNDVKRITTKTSSGSATASPTPSPAPSPAPAPTASSAAGAAASTHTPAADAAVRAA